jgi:hypothetical protein
VAIVATVLANGDVAGGEDNSEIVCATKGDPLYARNSEACAFGSVVQPWIVSQAILAARAADDLGVRAGRSAIAPTFRA